MTLPDISVLPDALLASWFSTRSGAPSATIVTYTAVEDTSNRQQCLANGTGRGDKDPAANLPDMSGIVPDDTRSGGGANTTYSVQPLWKEQQGLADSPPPAYAQDGRGEFCDNLATKWWHHWVELENHKF